MVLVADGKLVLVADGTMDSKYLTVILGELFGSIKLNSCNPKYLFRYASITSIYPAVGKQ